MFHFQVFYLSFFINILIHLFLQQKLRNTGKKYFSFYIGGLIAAPLTCSAWQNQDWQGYLHNALSMDCCNRGYLIIMAINKFCHLSKSVTYKSWWPFLKAYFGVPEQHQVPHIFEPFILMNFKNSNMLNRILMS